VREVGGAGQELGDRGQLVRIEAGYQRRRVLPQCARPRRDELTPALAVVNRPEEWEGQEGSEEDEAACEALVGMDLVAGSRVSLR
jgi:hypothetical protein